MSTNKPFWQCHPITSYQTKVNMASLRPTWNNKGWWHCRSEFWHKGRLFSQRIKTGKITSTTPSCGGPLWVQKSPIASKFSCASSPSPSQIWSKWKFHKIFLDTVLKNLFKKKNIPGSKCVSCSSFMDRKKDRKKKSSKKALKLSKIQILKNYWKFVLIKT